MTQVPAGCVWRHATRTGSGNDDATRTRAQVRSSRGKRGKAALSSLARRAKIKEPERIADSGLPWDSIFEAFSGKQDMGIPRPRNCLISERLNLASEQMTGQPRNTYPPMPLSATQTKATLKQATLLPVHHNLQSAGSADFLIDIASASIVL